ncbi:MAG: hypothetical protein EOO99_04550 [Pedobacter sp.]|nr:MAG: hypothetical protein EOO99_04550 [Pedobacter sp.]
MRIIGVFIGVLFSALQVFAQGAFTGNIFDNQSRNISIEGVTVRNITTKAITTTNRDGHFALPAKVGDLVSFSLLGYETDTLYLINLFPKNIYLRSNVNTLDAVDIKGVKISPLLTIKDPYATEARAVDYSQNRGGLRLNLGYGKYRRNQIKTQELEEDDEFLTEINQTFTPEFVSKLLKIEGQELKDFMNKNRPTIQMVKRERPFDYELYTAQQYSAWLKLSPEERKVQVTLKPLPKKENP